MRQRIPSGSVYGLRVLSPRNVSDQGKAALARLQGLELEQGRRRMDLLHSMVQQRICWICGGRANRIKIMQRPTVFEQNCVHKALSLTNIGRGGEIMILRRNVSAEFCRISPECP